MAILRLLPGQEPRVETGAVQFGDDWPGVFIRGDIALHIAMCLGECLNGGGDAFSRMTANNLIALLQSCDTRSTPPTEREQ